MDLYLDDDDSTSRQKDSSDEEVSPPAAALALRIIDLYIPSSFTNFQDKWLGSE